MGNNLDCHKIELEEETIEQIFNEIPISKMPLEKIYKEFMECVNETTPEDSTDKPYSLDYFKYANFLLPKIDIEENQYRNIHLDYFDNLRRTESRIENLGTILIFLSIGSKEEKIGDLINLFSKCYNTISQFNLNEYILNVIKANSNLCVYSFMSSLPKEGIIILNKVYDLSRQKNLANFIMSNYNSLYQKYFKDNNTPTQFDLDVKKNNNQIFLKEFFELIYSMMNGVYIRNWLMEEYTKNKSVPISGCCS